MASELNGLGCDVFLCSFSFLGVIFLLSYHIGKIFYPKGGVLYGWVLE